jgi:glycosyltransferase involved in cell wall biosynthesis
MNEPLISVVVPSYNQGDYIENTILSILGQEYPHWEVVIQDGGSVDKTHEVASKYAAADRRISFQSGKDKGFSDAVNKALQRCSGKFGIIQNSDDFFSSPGVFTQAVSYFKKYPDLYMLSAPFLRVDEHLDELVSTEKIQEEGFIKPYDLFTLRKIFGQSSTFFSMDRIRDIGYLRLDVDMVADTDTWIRMGTYRPTSDNKVYYAGETWGCATFHNEQRSTDQSKFMVGRARMFTNFLFDDRVDIPMDEKKRAAQLFISDAYEYLIRRQLPSAQIEEMYKKVTGESIPLRKKIKRRLYRNTHLRQWLKGTVEKDGTEYFLSLPRGRNYKWFAK